MKRMWWMIGLVGCLVGCSEQQTKKPETRPLVRVGAVSNNVVFVDSLRVQGMVRTRKSAKIAARIPGPIDVLLVEEGAHVKAGTPLFRVDQVNLANAVRAAKDDCTMAKAKLAETEALAAKAALDATRMARLLKNGAVTKDQAEKAEVAAKSYEAARAVARAAVTKAETGLAVAEKNFSDSEIRAPFDGVITRKFVEAGDFIGVGKPVFAMDDPSVREVCVSLNAAQYAKVEVGKTTLVLQDAPEKTAYPVTYRAPSVNPLTRTFEIRAVVPQLPSVAPGMIANCEVVFARRKAQALPASAIALREGGECLFKVSNGRVVRVPVTTGFSAGALREIVQPTLSSNDAVIVEGMLLVNEGDEVRTQDVAL